MITEHGMKHGDRFYSETKLCQIHKVSRPTIRQALSVMENEGLLTIRHGSGTFVQVPGIGIGAGTQNRAVGVISTYFSEYIFPGIVTGIEHVLTRNNFTMLLATTRNQVREEARAIKSILSQNVKGLIVEPSKSALPNPNSALYDEIRTRNIPLVFFNAKYPSSSFPCVAIDDEEAGYVVTDYLISQGHGRISAMLVFDDIQGHKRYRGFLRAFEKHVATMAEQRVMWFSTTDRDTLFTDSADRVLALVKDSTAVVCYDDSLAISLHEFCKSHGISVPADVSIVGIDDSTQASICEVPLTTVRHPQQQLGEKAAEVLLDMIKNPSSEAGDILFAPNLIERSSVAKHC